MFRVTFVCAGGAAGPSNRSDAVEVPAANYTAAVGGG
jgi:hypothetical protein